MVSLLQKGKRVRIRVTPANGPDLIVNATNLVHQFRIAFSVRKTNDSQPSQGSATITNLGKGSRDRMAGIIRRRLDTRTNTEFVDDVFGGTTVVGSDGFARQVEALNGYSHMEIEAGYGDNLTTIFSGGSTWVRTRREGVHRVTELKSSDGGPGDLAGNARKTFSPDVDLFTVVRYLVTAGGWGKGNLTRENLLAAVFVPADFPFAAPGRSTFPDGFSVNGRPRATLDELLSVQRVRWFIDDGEFYVISNAGFIQGPPALVEPRRALIGEPQWLPSGSPMITMRMRPDIRLGRLVAIGTGELRGQWVVQEARHAGDNRVGDFNSTFILKRLETVEGVF